MGEVAVEKVEKVKEKAIKARVEIIRPEHVIECYRLLEQSLRAAPADFYPDCSEITPEAMRIYLYNYITQPGFVGVTIRVGKRPVGQILAAVHVRPFGKPNYFAFIWNFWIDPEFRKKGLMTQLWFHFSDECRKKQVFHWEADAADELTQSLLHYHKIPTRKLSTRIGGRT
jgi:GNAT superfamily N-acetyltransferase